MDDVVDKVSLLVDLAISHRMPCAVTLHDALTVVLTVENPASRFAAGAGRLVPRLTPEERSACSIAR